MKTSNPKKIKNIRNFFEIMYYLFIGILSISVITEIVKIFTGKFKVGSFPMFFMNNNPGISLHANGLDIIPKSLSGFVSVSLTEAPISMSIISFAAMIIKTSLIILMIYIIRKIIETVGNNNLFSEVNASRLRKIGDLLLADFLIGTFKVFIFSLYFGSFDMTNLSYFLGYMIGNSLDYLLVIVFIYFIAAIFRIGVSMQEENQSFI